MENIMPIVWLLAIAWAIINVILTFKLIKACNIISEINNTLKSKNRFNPQILLSHEAFANDIRDSLLTQLWQNYTFLEQSERMNVQSGIDVYHQRIGVTLSQLQGLYAQFKLGELPSQFQSVDSFISYCRPLTPQ